MVEFETKVVDLQKIRFALQQVELDHVASDLKYEGYRDLMNDWFVHKIIASFWAKQKSYECNEERIPKTWWDAFKQRWFPDWYLLRWPVRWEIIKTNSTVYYMFPGLNLSVPENQAKLQFLLTEPHSDHLIDFVNTAQTDYEEWKQRALSAEDLLRVWNYVEIEEKEDAGDDTIINYWKDRAYKAETLLNEMEKKNVS